MCTLRHLCGKPWTDSFFTVPMFAAQNVWYSLLYTLHWNCVENFLNVRKQNFSKHCNFSTLLFFHLKKYLSIAYCCCSTLIHCVHFQVSIFKMRSVFSGDFFFTIFKIVWIDLLQKNFHLQDNQVLIRICSF